MKKCFKCSIEKPLTEYYKHNAMADGYLGKCKDCTKEDTKKRTNELSKNPQWIEAEKERHRDKYHRLEYKGKHKPTSESKKIIMDRYKNKYPEKMKAKSLSGKLKAIVNGNELHHWSYRPEHAKNVIELSVKEHNTAHRFLIYDQERMMYRSLDGVLLDTLESHLEYILRYIEIENSCKQQ